MPATMPAAMKKMLFQIFQVTLAIKGTKKFTAPKAKNTKAATMENGLNSSRSNHAAIPAVIQPTPMNITARDVPAIPNDGITNEMYVTK
jgi:predicted phage tail protein